MNPKKDYEKAIKKSVSMPGLLYDDGEQRRRQLRFAAFSDYIQFLIREDVQRSIAAATSGITHR